MTNYLPNVEPLSAADIDRRLEKAVSDHERAEKLICLYLNQIKRRRLYESFGYQNVYDYALERFGFCFSKTRSLLFLGRRLSQLPALTEALAKGRLGWTKAAKVASVAEPATDEEWTERAVALSFRELERKIRDDVPARGGRVSLYLTAEQASIWTRALELCRRVSGEQIDPGLALEYIAGEFLATYQASVEQLDGDIRFDAAKLVETQSEDAGHDESVANVASRARDDGGGRSSGGDDAHNPHPESLSKRVPNETIVDPVREERLCPARDPDLPTIEARPYADIHREVLERDGYRCQYPGCSVRAGLHAHHIEFRSRFGKKFRASANRPENLTTLCWFHHRMLHAEVIGLTGTAPDALVWRRPALLESAEELHDIPGDDAFVDSLDAAELPNVWQSGGGERMQLPSSTATAAGRVEGSASDP